MKRNRFRPKTLEQLALAVSASALMLGASQAQTTIGINFQGSYGGSYAGSTVSATAFGVPATNWFTDPNDAPSGSMMISSPTDTNDMLTVNWNSADTWCSGLYPEIILNGGTYTTPNPLPGDGEVLWGYLDDPSPGATASVSGLKSVFSNGYVIQTIAAEVYNVSFADTTVSSATTNEVLSYVYYWYPPNFFGPPFDNYGTAGLSAPSIVFSDDTINVAGGAPVNSLRGPICGFIITDVPVVTYSAPDTTIVAPGGSFVLTASVLGVGNLSYQWQHDGTNIPGATFVNYTNNSVALADGGNYQVIANSSLFPSSPATGQVLTVTVHLPQTLTWDANTNSTGTHPQDGSGTWSLAGDNWWNGSSDTNLYANDTAVFGVGGTGAYTVTLTDNVTANALTFDSGDYTITNTLGESITLQGAAEITANAPATILAPLSTGTNTFLKAGAGTLVITNGGLSCASTIVSAGTLEVLTKDGGDSPYVISNGATLEIGYTTAGGYANTGMQIYGNGVSATTGLYLAGGTTYNVSGTMTLLGAPTTIRQFGTGLASLGIFDVNDEGLLCTAAASGSMIETNVQMVSDGYGMAVQANAGANTATGDLVINGPLNIGPQNGIYGLVTRGTGSVLLNGVATSVNCGLDMLDGSVICGTDECIGTNAILQISAGATLYLNTTIQTVANLLTTTATPAVLGTLNIAIDKGGTPSSGLLIESDGNPMYLSGNLVVTNIGGALALGDTFTLFNSSGGFSGGFTSVVLPSLADGLGWSNNLAVDGTIKVVVGGGPSFVLNLPGTTNYAFVGGNSIYSITAAGDLPLHYQWFQNGTTPVGSNSPTLALTDVTLADAGFYYVFVTNNYGTAYSQTNYLVVVPTTGYEALLASLGPVSFWPLNESSGTTAIDYWSGYDATYSGGYTLDQTTNPVTGTAAVQFDGTSGHALTPYFPALNPTVFSAEAWVNPATAPATTTEFCAFCCGQFASAGRSGWLIYQFTGYWNLRTYYDNGTAAAVNLAGTSAPVIGSWTHLAATWDGTTARLYVNGALEGSQVPTNTPNYVPGASGGFCVGSRADNAFYWAGAASDAVLYNRVLTPLEISTHAGTGLSIAQAGTNVVLTWVPSAGGKVQAAPTLAGPYTNVVAATSSPWTNSASGQSMFYRLKF
jgi:hypothetical protein